MILHRFRLTPKFLLIVAALSLLGMGMCSLVIESVTFRSVDNGEAAKLMNAPFMRMMTLTQEATVELYYRGYGNTSLRLTPRFCFSKGFRLNGEEHTLPNNQDSICGDTIIDFAPWLKPGGNTLTLTITSFEKPDAYSPTIGLAVGPPLLGTYLPQSGFTLLFFASLLALAWLLLARQGHNGLICVLFIAACLMHLEFLHGFGQFAYTLDLEKHIPYLQFASNDFFHPYNYTGPEGWHPPLYYWIGSLIARALQFTGVFDAWTGLHALSFLCYMTFLYFGMRTITQLIHGRLRYLALALLFFWPSGIPSATWIFNDVLVYPFYAAGFYYTVAWYESGKPWTLAKAMLYCALTFMVKTTGLVPASILGMTLLFALVTRQHRLRSFLNRPFLIGLAALAAGVVFNMGKSLYHFVFTQNAFLDHLGGRGGYDPNLVNFLPVNLVDLFRHPFFLNWEDKSLWNLQTRTLLFTNSIWGHEALATALEAMWALMLIYIALYTLTVSRKKCLSLFPVIAGAFLPFVACITFTLIIHMGSCMDIRYVQPVLIALSILYVRALEETQANDWPILYYAGILNGLGFVGVSIALFQMQLH